MSLHKRDRLVAGMVAGLWLVLACGPLLAEPAAEFQPFVFIHAGDTEIGSPTLKGTSERFALEAQRANAIGAAFVVIAGDLLHDWDAEHLAAFEDGLKQFTMPVKVVPGNHDDLEMFRERFGPDHYVFTHHNCDFVCLNSNVLDVPRGDAVGGAEWRWLEAALKESRRQGRTHIFVVMHHPMTGQARLDELLAQCGVEAVLCGHTHTTVELRGKGYVAYVAPGTAKFRDGKGLGYRVFKVYKDRIEQEMVPLGREVTKYTATQ